MGVEGDQCAFDFRDLLKREITVFARGDEHHVTRAEDIFDPAGFLTHGIVADFWPRPDIAVIGQAAGPAILEAEQSGGAVDIDDRSRQQVEQVVGPFPRRQTALPVGGVNLPHRATEAVAAVVVDQAVAQRLLRQRLQPRVHGGAHGQPFGANHVRAIGGRELAVGLGAEIAGLIGRRSVGAEL